MAIVALIAAGAGIFGTLFKPLTATIFKATPALHNIEIVIDRSVNMNEPTGNSTKWEQAKRSVINALQLRTGEEDKIALREFGGDCASLESTKKTIDFAKNNEKRIIEAIQKMNPHGQATLIQALVEASSDFGDIEKFPPASTKTIIVVASAFDCWSTAELDVLRKRFKPIVGIELSFRFIGFRIKEKDKEEFELLAKETGGSVIYSSSKSELSNHIINAINYSSSDEQLAIKRVESSVTDKLRSNEQNDDSYKITEGPNQDKFSNFSSTLEGKSRSQIDEKVKEKTYEKYVAAKQLAISDHSFLRSLEIVGRGFINDKGVSNCNESRIEREAWDRCEEWGERQSDDSVDIIVDHIDFSSMVIETKKEVLTTSQRCEFKATVTCHYSRDPHE